MTGIVKRNFDEITHIELKNYRPSMFRSLESFFEMVVLGHIESFGYFNKIGPKRRVLAALLQTLWSMMFLGLATLCFHKFWNNSCECDRSIDLEGYIGFAALLAAIFGANFVRESRDVYSKFDYLAGVFNSIIQLDANKEILEYNNANKREHLLGCLAHDLITMNMWAHRSFTGIFNEVIKKAVILDLHKNGVLGSHTLALKLEAIASHGINTDDAKDLISRYIEEFKPRSTTPEALFDHYMRY